MTPPREVLRRYPSWLVGSASFLGNQGGFSGAQLWKLESGRLGSFCLKAWPPAWRCAADLAWVHGLLQKAADLAFVPRVLPTDSGVSFVSFDNRLWDVTTWQPGRADFADSPSRTRLQAAMTALAQLHSCWSAADSMRDVCPAVSRRQEEWQTWQLLLQTGWRPSWTRSDPYTSITLSLWHLVHQLAADFEPLLDRWRLQSLPLQPCVCDPWHDHILFSGDVVTGLIDYGSAKIDHIAVDLARLLGSLVSDDAELWQVGLDAYAQVRPLTSEEILLAHDLDQTGTIIAATNWLRWLYLDQRRFEPAAMLRRLGHLQERLQAITGT